MSLSLSRAQVLLFAVCLAPFRSGALALTPLPSPHAQATHLLKYDSTLGPFAGTVSAVDDHTLSVDGKHIRVRFASRWLMCQRLKTGDLQFAGSCFH